MLSDSYFYLFIFVVAISFIPAHLGGLQDQITDDEDDLEGIPQNDGTGLEGSGLGPVHLPSTSSSSVAIQTTSGPKLRMAEEPQSTIGPSSNTTTAPFPAAFSWFGLSIAALGGIVAAIVALIILVVVLVVFLVKKSRGRRNSNESQRDHIVQRESRDRKPKPRQV